MKGFIKYAPLLILFAVLTALFIPDKYTIDTPYEPVIAEGENPNILDRAVPLEIAQNMTTEALLETYLQNVWIDGRFLVKTGEKQYDNGVKMLADRPDIKKVLYEKYCGLDSPWADWVFYTERVAFEFSGFEQEVQRDADKLENLALAIGLDMDKKTDRRILTEIERRFAYNTARNGFVELRYQSPYLDGLYWKQVEDRVFVSRG